MARQHEVHALALKTHKTLVFVPLAGCVTTAVDSHPPPKPLWSLRAAEKKLVIAERDGSESSRRTPEPFDFNKASYANHGLYKEKSLRFELTHLVFTMRRRQEKAQTTSWRENQKGGKRETDGGKRSRD